MSLEAVRTALQVNATTGNAETAEHKLRVHGCFSSHSFWKRGSFRSGSNIGSSRRSAGVSGVVSTPLYGVESSFCKAAMARSASPIRHSGRNLNRNRTSESVVLERVHGCFPSQSFWKAGSARKGSQIGSSLRCAGVTGAAI
jgi:hypothetical protein